MTTPLQIAAFYVVINAFITLILVGNVVRVRVKTRTLIGDGGNDAMVCAIRAHANNVEYTPIILLMLVLLALLHTPIIVVHVVGASLALGRALHGFGLARSSGTSLGRGLGMALTLAAFLIALVALALRAFA